MGKLSIHEIAKVLVTKNGLEQSEANRFATEMFSIIQERLEQNDQVKVKGLGTWKVITVEARESVSVRTGDRVTIGEHSKITFTPDATMKELVNKPFSQFETVVLNDNVEFDDLKEQPDDAEFEDIKDDLTEEELSQLGQLEASAVTAEETPITAEEMPVTPEETPITAEEMPVTPEETPDEEASDPVADADEEDNKFSFKWGWFVLGTLFLMAISAAGGYYFGRQQTTSVAVSDTVFVKDTVYVAESQDTAIVDVSEVPVPEQASPTSQKEVTPVQEEKTTTPAPAQVVDKYAQKDERVRLGAYRIVGLDHEVKVLPGQTFYSICRAHLGPDMECYIEVYNDLPRNPQIKAGQVIKIPKLQLKKRKK